MENVATRQFLTSGTRHFLLACLRTADIVTQFFTSFSLSVVSDQCSTSLGKANVRCGEGGIPSEVAAQVPFPVTLNDGFQYARHPSALWMLLGRREHLSRVRTH